jgi:hypothetical protein
VSRTLAFESCLLLLKIFKIDVLEILRHLALYGTIDRLETSNMMMQWLDRFCRYETFGTKSLKTELQLKRYRTFNLQELDCKYTWARY